LDRCVSNGARAACDEDVLSGQRAGTQLRWSVLCDGERAVRCGGRDADAGPEVEARGFGERKDALRGDNGELLRGSTCGAAVSREGDPDPVADLETGDTGADVIDDPRPVMVWNSRFHRIATRRAARFPVGWVDAGNRYADPHLAGSGFASPAYTSQYSHWSIPFRVLVYRSDNPRVDPLTLDPLTYYEAARDDNLIYRQQVRPGADPDPNPLEVGPKYNPITGEFTNKTPEMPLAFTIDSQRGLINFAFPQSVLVRTDANLPAVQRYSPADIELANYSSWFLDTPVLSHVFYSALSLALAGLFLWRRDPADLVMVALQLSGVAFAASFFIISIACDYRYLYFTDLAAMVGLVYVAIDPPTPWRRRRSAESAA